MERAPLEMRTRALVNQPFKASARHVYVTCAGEAVLSVSSPLSSFPFLSLPPLVSSLFLARVSVSARRSSISKLLGWRRRPAGSASAARREARGEKNTTTVGPIAASFLLTRGHPNSAPLSLVAAGQLYLRLAQQPTHTSALFVHSLTRAGARTVTRALPSRPAAPAERERERESQVRAQKWPITRASGGCACALRTTTGQRADQF